MFRRMPYGSVYSYAPIHVDSNDPKVLEYAFKKRLMRDVPEPEETSIVRFKRFVKKWLDSHVPKVAVMGFEDWLEGTNYTIERKDELRDVHLWMRGGPPTRRQRSSISTFVKTEFYTEYKQGRMINSRSDACKCFFGPRFKPIEEVLYSLPSDIDPGHPYFIKHVPVTERPALIERLASYGPYFYSNDYTAFESHFTKEIMEACELQLYRHCLKDDPYCELLCRTISGENRMKMRNGTRAKVMARRMSGDMCTSLGNGFTNLMIALFLAEEHHCKLDGFVEGDDGLFACDGQLTTEMFSALGFTTKIEKVMHPREASFCGNLYSEDLQIVKNPYKFLQGFGWTSSFIEANTSKLWQLLKAKALSALCETPDCPIISTLAHRAYHKCGAVKPIFVQDGYHDTSKIPPFVRAPSPTLRTREFFQQQFGDRKSVV